MRPVIGITSSYEKTDGVAPRERSTINAAYTDAVYAAGGLPFPIALPPQVDVPLLTELLGRCDGLIFSGGPDLDPRHYGQTPHPKTHLMHARRDAFDLPLFRVSAARDVPTLSICLGCQLANVACGGKLIQHVDDVRRDNAVRHYQDDGTAAFHPVSVEPESLVARIVGRREFEVNSRHHQLVDREQIGSPLRAVAFAPDGVVEAVEDSTRKFMLAVQWHPEDMIDRPEHLALFRALVDVARR
ncbi:MAG: gamma-glutamyl-gamma-aminobutyrate hydrolase family protein [Phycisphaerae bacterium]